MRRFIDAISIITAVIVTICVLTVSAWSNELTDAPKPPLIQQGTVEISTLGLFIGSNVLGLGLLKAEDDWMGTLGLSIGYFPLSFAELEGSVGAMKIWNEDYSQTTTIGIGKLVLNYVTQRATTVIPYAFGGGGLIGTGFERGGSFVESETDALLTFGGGLKVPLVLVKQSALRVEYSYIKNLADEEEEREPVHAISIGFSVFF